MDDAEIDAVLSKALEAEGALVRSSYIIADLEKLAPIFSDAETRPIAEAVIAEWVDGGDQLRKAMSMAWLSRARSILGSAAGAVEQAVGHVTGVAHQVTSAPRRAYQAAENAAGNLGAAAGEKFARSPLNAGRMAGATQAGGDAAAASMEAKLQPRGVVHSNINVQASALKGPRLQVEGAARNFTAETVPSGSGISAEQRSALGRAAAVDGARSSGARLAADAHAGQMARHGRIAARHAFKAGLIAGSAAGTAAVGGAISGHLSQKQHDERVAAAHAQRHRGAERMMVQKMSKAAQ